MVTTVVIFTLLFFFQAEDGIRDYKVTGVQTCALPISARRSSPGWRSKRPASTPCSPTNTARAWAVTRSEERRVGKECRWGWSQHDYKKKTMMRNGHE